MSLTKKSLRIAAALSAVPAACVLAAGPALAAGTVSVSNQETIQAHLDASGNVQDARVYEQLAFEGDGTVSVADPVSTKNLRNLDAFGGLDVRDGKLVGTFSVNGERRLRTVSDYDKSLPLTVKATYKLDGRTVDPGDVVGRSGLLEVHYTVTNTTGRTEPVTYDDGTGKQVTQDETVVIPMVGSLTTTLPSTFTDVQSAEAAIAGDGHGATKMTYTMTLFGPIGSPTAEFGYTARITDGVIPPATVSALPVSPLDSPSFKGGAASYKGGADTGLELTAGATQIDTTVLKLRDGAQQLLAGLLQLRDGADQLHAGLTGQAVPGAARLADGADRLKAGTGQLASGAADARSGSGKLAAGAGLLAEAFRSSTGRPDLSSGSQALAGGVGRISGGLDELAGVNGLPAALKGLQGLRAGLDHPVHAAGAADPGGLLQGLQQIAAGLSNPACSLADPSDPKNPCGVTEGLTGVAAGISNPHCVLSSPTDPKNPCGVREVVNEVATQLTGAAASGGAIDQLASAAVGAYQQSLMAPGTPCPPSGAGQAVPVPPVLPPSVLTAAPLSLPASNVCVLLSNVVYGLNLPAATLSPSDPGGLRPQTAAAGAGLSQVVGAVDGSLLPGVAALQAGVAQLTAGAGSARDAVTTLVLPGVDALIDGITTAVFGVDQLATGARTAKAGAGALAGGVEQAANGADQLSAGTRQLDSGLGRLSTGAGQVDSGAGQVAEGATQLSTGLGDAASGSGRLAEGLTKAADSAPALPAGASRLSAEGTSKLIEAGKATAADYGLKYALIAAGAERAKAEGMAYGAPANATGTTAYSLELAGATGEGSRNLGRGAGALALFGMGAAATVLRRRWV